MQMQLFKKILHKDSKTSRPTGKTFILSSSSVQNVFEFFECGYTDFTEKKEKNLHQNALFISSFSNIASCSHLK